MKIKEIQEIINFIKKSDLDDVSIETESIKIRVKKKINIKNTQFTHPQSPTQSKSDLSD